MSWLALLVAAAAAVYAGLTRRSVQSEVENLAGDLHHRKSEFAGLREELERRLRVLSLQAAQLAEGQSVSSERIREGRLWDEVDVKEAHRIFRAEEPSVLLDVRTPEEFRNGHAPGARLLPVDQLERRAGEVPREGRVIVYCSTGARSTSACEFLSDKKGYTNLCNVTGGFNGWPEELETGTPAQA